MAPLRGAGRACGRPVAVSPAVLVPPLSHVMGERGKWHPFGAPDAPMAVLWPHSGLLGVVMVINLPRKQYVRHSKDSPRYQKIKITIVYVLCKIPAFCPLISAVCMSL